MNVILKEIFEKADSLDLPEQRELATLVESFIDARSLPAINLTDDQVAEVVRRQNDINPTFISVDEARSRIDALLA